MKDKNLYLGVDVGSSAVKLAVVQDDGNIVARASESYDATYPGKDWVEINPELWVDAFVCAAQRLFKLIDRNNIRRIGITGQMHTLILLGENGEIIRPAIMWNDLRTKNMIAKIKEDIKDYVDGEYLSSIISPGSPLVNILWVKEEEPEIFQKIKKFHIGWDYLVYRFTGNHCTDYCNASTSSMFSLIDKCWSKEIQEYVGIPMSCYPEILCSVDTAGNITEEFRERLGFDEKVEVIVGTGDNPATILATGGYWNKVPAFSLGTSGVITRRFSGISKNYFGKRVLVSFHKGECEIFEQGTVQSCASTYDWWRNQLGDIDTVKKIEHSVNIEKEAYNRVLFYPHLAGDKTLYADSDLRGMFVGMDLKTTQVTMLYSVLEGLSFAIRELIEKMNVFEHSADSLQVVGGASDNELWMQILANVLGKKIKKVHCTAGAVYGIALLCAKIENIGELRDFLQGKAKIMKVYAPADELKVEYDKKYKYFLRMRNAIHYILYEEV